MSQSSAPSEMTANNQANSEQPVNTPYAARPPRNQRSRQPDARVEQPTQQQSVEKVQPEKANRQAEKSQPNADDEPKRLSLAELFGDSDDPDNESGSGISTDDPSKPPDSIEGVTKRLGLKPEQVYAIKVPMPNGAEPLTIGDLKDRVGELVDLETREMQFDQRRMKSEGELLRSQTEMREILAAIPKDQIPQGIVDKVRQRHEQTMARERELTLEHIPEWKSEKTMQEDVQGIIELCGNYGFDPTFITTVVDHRALKMLRDFYKMDSRIKKALAGVTIPSKKGQRPSGKGTKPASKPGQQQSQRRQNVVADQRSRIVNLFSSSE